MSIKSCCSIRGGTSLEGHFHSTRRGVVIDTSKLNKILAINDNDLDVVVQAGVNWQDLNQVLEPYGLMFGTDCGHGLISGMIGTNARGLMPRDMVLCLQTLYQ